MITQNKCRVGLPNKTTKQNGLIGLFGIFITVSLIFGLTGCNKEAIADKPTGIYSGMPNEILHKISYNGKLYNITAKWNGKEKTYLPVINTDVKEFGEIVKTHANCAFQVLSDGTIKFWENKTAMIVKDLKNASANRLKGQNNFTASFYDHINYGGAILEQKSNGSFGSYKYYYNYQQTDAYWYGTQATYTAAATNNTYLNAWGFSNAFVGNNNNDRISSIKCLGYAPNKSLRLIFFEHSNFGGKALSFDLWGGFGNNFAGVPNLTIYTMLTYSTWYQSTVWVNWNDQISSYMGYEI